jgi:poly-D-alanine transfer protein DltD
MMEGRRKDDKSGLVNKIVRYIQADGHKINDEKYMIRDGLAHLGQRTWVAMMPPLSGGFASCICVCMLQG